MTDEAVTGAANTVTVLGGPTALIRLAGWTLLTDPTFDAAGTEYQDGPVTVRKTADPALKPAQLPTLDAVLVSHTGHLDNLDTAGRTVASGASAVLTTVAGAEDLGGAAVGLEPWQTRTLSMPGRTPLNITAVPARHGPVGTEAVTGPVTGFLLHTGDGSAPTVYVSGDTVDLDAMSALAGRYRVDVALLHLGAAGFEAFGDIRLSLTAAQAVEARRLLGDPLVVAVHAEGWAHYTEDRNHVQQTFDAAGAPLHWPTPGEPITLPGKNMTPEVVHERFARYLRDQDLDGLGSLFDEHAMFVPGPGQEPVYGRESIKEALKPYLASPSTMEVKAASVHQNGDLAMVQPSWRITSEDGIVEGKAVEVMRRTSEGDWVYIIDNPYGV